MPVPQPHTGSMASSAHRPAPRLDAGV